MGECIGKGIDSAAARLASKGVLAFAARRFDLPKESANHQKCFPSQNVFISECSTAFSDSRELSRHFV